MTAQRECSGAAISPRSPVKGKMTLTVDSSQGGDARDQENATQSSFESLLQVHWNRVYGVLFRLVGDRAEAEDLTLEVFWRLHTKPPRFSFPERLEAWLYRVATNLGYNALRSARRRRRYENLAGLAAYESRPRHNPAVEVERAEARQNVRQVLGRMKPLEARLLVLRHSGLSYREVAQALDLKPSTIGKRLSRAERKFERLYQTLVGGM